MDKILFIVPPNLPYDSFVNPNFNERVITKKSGKKYGSLVAEMPLGLLSLSAYLKRYGSKDKIVDFNIVLNKLESFEFGSFPEFFRDFLSASEWRDFAPSIVGISALFTPQYQSMLDIARCCREIFPNAIIVAGGGVPTNMYKEIFRDSVCFDALCLGEGEKPLLGLVGAGDKLRYLEESPSWITRRKIENGQSFQHDFIENLDEIPFYDYSALNINDYEQNSLLSLFPLEKERQKRGFPVMTSRGCPHYCCFCSSHTVHGRKVRYHSVGRIREDFKRLRERYGAETIIFNDDHLMASKRRVYEIIEILKELQLTPFFPSSLALYALDKKILKALKSVGMNNLVLSVESGSTRVLKEIMHKPLDLSIVKRILRDCRELGISTDVSILIGLPGETKQDIEDTLSFLKKLDATWFRISMATPLVGSEMLDMCLKNNYIKGDYISCDFKKAVIETNDFTAEYIQEKAYAMNLELNFVLNSDVRLGNYSTALKGFENVIRVREDHAFAYYFAAQCCKMMNLDEKYLVYKARYREIIEGSAFWRNYVNQFKLVELE